MTARPVAVAFVTEATRIGGGEVSLLGLLDRLDRRRFKPVVLCYGRGSLADRLGEMGVPVHHIERRSRASEPLLIARMTRIFRHERIALVHVNSLDIRAGIAAILAGDRLLGHLRVIMPFRWVDRLFVRLADRVFSVSRAAAAALCSGAPGLRRRFRLLPNAVTIPAPAPICRNDLGLPSDALLVGVVGRLDPVKGIEYLIEALPAIRSRHPEVCALVVGEPGPIQVEQDYARSLESRTEELGLSGAVRFTGYRGDALSIIAALDVLVVPSVRIRTPSGSFEEGFGRVAVEAMAAGVPVVATRTGGLPEVLAGGEAGLLVDERDPRGLADAVLCLLTDRDLHQRLSQAGRRRYLKHYTLTQHVREVERHYAALV